MLPNPCRFCQWKTTSFRALKEHWEICPKRWWWQLKEAERELKEVELARDALEKEETDGGK